MKYQTPIEPEVYITSNGTEDNIVVVDTSIDYSSDTPTTSNLNSTLPVTTVSNLTTDSDYSTLNDYHVSNNEFYSDNSHTPPTNPSFSSPSHDHNTHS